MSFKGDEISDNLTRKTGGPQKTKPGKTKEKSKENEW
jgi:hypothetical protein